VMRWGMCYTVVKRRCPRNLCYTYAEGASPCTTYMLMRLRPVAQAREFW